MPIRLARFSDLPTLAHIIGVTFGPDHFFQVMFPHQEEYPQDFLNFFKRGMRVSWWDYSKVIMVSYLETSTSELDNLDFDRRKLVVYRNGLPEILTGMSEWKRVGFGWESVWGVLGWWDPRCLIKRLQQVRNKVLDFLYPCRAVTQPTPEDPDPLLFTNFETRIAPWTKRLYSDPLKPWRKSHWYLEVLCIHPHYQSQGHGKDLVQYGLARANGDTASGRTGIPCLVTSSPRGELFYQRVGFKEVVGYSTKSVEEVEGVNPLEEKGCKGGAVIWSWVTEDEELARKANSEKAR